MVSRTFAQRIKDFRESQGLTQSELGKMLGVSSNYVGILEGGKETDPQSSLYKLFELLEAKALNQSPGPRGLLKAALKRSGMDVKELSKKIGRPIGYLQTVIDGSATLTQATAEEIAKAIPELSLEVLLGGSDSPMLQSTDGITGTYGSKPDVDLEPGSKGRMIPLLSWAQAGGMDANHLDESYAHEAVLAVDISDRKAFGLMIRGDSMSPVINEGDIALVCPSWKPRSGDVVIARTVNGDVMCKLYQPQRGGIKLSSYNPAFPVIDLDLSEVDFIYPVASTQKRFRRHE